ncbi:hypothetical protein CPB86DRAFT_791300 [Serendipita vermifera]|nr:hypothetical protein CPB86DRAFT_791300 [Serendipita vermifera]
MLGPVDMEKGCNLEHHDLVVPILRQGCEDLYRLKTRPIPSDQLKKKLDEAIILDKFDFEKETTSNNMPIKSNPQRIMVYFMDNPDAEPKVFTEKYTKYSELRCRLMNQRLVKRGELWIRHENRAMNGLTPKGRYWERAKPTSDIDEVNESLEMDILELKNTNPYMVALLHDEHDRELPMPLEIEIGGGDCCVPNCGDLRRHLEKIWETRIVIRALRLAAEPAGCTNVFPCPLNDDFFDRDITELYLQCRPRPSS